MMIVKNLLLTLFVLAFVTVASGCNQEAHRAVSDDPVAPVASQSQAAEAPSPVFEVAVRMVKPGKKDAFVQARSQFISVLKAQPGVSNDREFQSFYALPEPDAREVFIGMTQYASAEALKAAESAVYGAFGPFAETMDLKVYLFVQPIEGGPFDLANLAAREGQVLEVAVRRVKEGQDEAFQSTRRAFVDWLDGQDGVLQSWEFTVVAGQDTERLTVGMSVYESQDAFQAVATKTQALPEAGAYFATFDPVALQYAFSTTN